MHLNQARIHKLLLDGRKATDYRQTCQRVNGRTDGQTDGSSDLRTAQLDRNCELQRRDPHLVGGDEKLFKRLQTAQGKGSIGMSEYHNGFPSHLHIEVKQLAYWLLY